MNAKLVEAASKISQTAQAQREGAFTTESDACVALELIKELADAIVAGETDGTIQEEAR
jgi:hypothetical protein